MAISLRNESVPQLKSSLEQGGQVLQPVVPLSEFSLSSRLPVNDALVEQTDKGCLKKHLSGESITFLDPVLEMYVFDNRFLSIHREWTKRLTSCLMRSLCPLRLSPNASKTRRKKPICLGLVKRPLKSGWLGTVLSEKCVTALEATIGKRRKIPYACGTQRLTFRAQSPCTFKMLFNGLYK